MSRTYLAASSRTDVAASILDKMEQLRYPVPLINRWAQKLWTGLLDERELTQLPGLVRMTTEETVQFNWHYRPAG